MSIEKQFNEYVFELSKNHMNISNIKYILVTMGEDINKFRYNSASDYPYLLDFLNDYDTNMTPVDILNVELIEQDRKIGAIYEKIDGKFKLVVKKGF